ncbi:MAG: hypothetical protein NTZ13_01775 [Candidatus Parcubacteria bacterium]|nr:hypothetical protein [Candidatus Parcubacteria bacterium]
MHTRKDKSILFKSMDKENNKKEKFVLGTVLQAKDDIDSYILSEIVQLPMYLQAEVLIFFGRNKEDKPHEKHFGQMIDLGHILTKTNDSLRNYEKVQKESIETFREKSLKDTNQNIYLTTKSPELDREIDYFLSGIKSALDQLGQILGHILDENIDGWHKGVENGKELSGIKIVRKLQSLKLKDEYKSQRYQNLIDHLEVNLEPLTYLVKLRDMTHHRGGMKNISDIMFDSDTKQVQPQVIHHSKDEAELVLGFMKRTMVDFNLFVNNFIILTYMLKAPGDMAVQRRDNPFGYNWVILQPKLSQN